MDLLAGYGSSSEESDEESSSRGLKGKGVDDDGAAADDHAFSAAATTLHRARNANGAAPRPPTVPPRTAPSSAVAAANDDDVTRPASHSSSSFSERGRKVLSLTSFLPPKVLARLTKAQALHLHEVDDDDDSSNSSSDDDGDNNNAVYDDRMGVSSGSVAASAASAAKMNRGTASDGNGNASGRKRSEGLSTLLQDLRAAKPSSNSLGGTVTATTSPAKLTTAPASAGTAAVKTTTSLGLGQAFVAVHSVTKTSRNAEGNAAEVIDVHRKPTTTTNRTTASRGTEESRVASSMERQRTLPIPRPVAAAPGIVHQHIPVQAVEPPPLYGGDRQHVHDPSYGQATPQASQIMPTGTKKRSRKELERALRRGNMDALQDPSHLYGVDVQALRQADPSEYARTQDSSAQHEASALAAQQHLPHHGIRVGPTVMYDASAGTTTTVMVGAHGGGGGGDALKTMKGRGKNQIHHVVAAAAQLEMQRARQAGTNPSGNTSASTHRANAKAKYGW